MVKITCRAFLIAREEETFDVAFSKGLRCKAEERPKVQRAYVLLGG